MRASAARAGVKVGPVADLPLRSLRSTLSCGLGGPLWAVRARRPGRACLPRGTDGGPAARISRSGLLVRRAGTAEFITCEGLDHYENHAGKHAGVFFGNGEGISKLFDFLTKAKKA